MTDAVLPVQLRLERHERIVEVGHAEAAVSPPVEVLRVRGEVLGVVREPGRECPDRLDDRLDVGARGAVVAGIRNRSILSLDSLERDRRILQREPGGGVLDTARAAVLHNLGFADDGLERTGLVGLAEGHGNLRSEG